MKFTDIEEITPAYESIFYNRSSINKGLNYLPLLTKRSQFVGIEKKLKDLTKKPKQLLQNVRHFRIRKKLNSGMHFLILLVEKLVVIR